MNKKNSITALLIIALFILVACSGNRLYDQQKQREGWYILQEEYTQGFATPAYFSDQESKSVILLDGTIFNFAEGEVQVPGLSQKVKFSLKESGEWFRIIADPIDQKIITSLLASPCGKVVYQQKLKKVVILSKENRGFLEIKLLSSREPDEKYVPVRKK